MNRGMATLKAPRKVRKPATAMRATPPALRATPATWVAGVATN